MGDVSIIIKDGHIVSVDGSDGDDSDNVDGSGSGENEIESNSTDSPSYFTPTSNSTFQKVSSPDDDNLLPYIIAAVGGLVLLILVVVIIVWCRRKKRRKSPKKQNTGPVVYSPNGCEGAVGGDSYSVAVPLTIGEPPLEEAPPPPVPVGRSGSAASTMSTRYTPLGGRKGPSVVPVAYDDEKESIYETIDDIQVANVYEEPAPALPKSNSGRRPRPLSSVGEDPNMGSEKDKMLPPSSPV